MDGSRGIGVGIGVVIFAFLALLPFLLAFAIYAFLAIYAMTKGTAFAGSTVDVPVILAGVAVVVAAWLLVLFGLITLVGRSLAPRRRRSGAKE